MNELVVRPPTSTSLFPSPAEWSMLKEQASMVVKTGFLPRAVDTPERAIAIALKGRELGIPPMQAFSHIHIIDGKPTISAELMLSLIYKNCPGAVVNYLQSDEKGCVIEAGRPGHKLAKFSFMVEDARQAGLLNKSNYKSYPAAMYRARTVAIVGRAIFADAIMGCSYIPEELGADVDDEGTVVSIPASDPNSNATSGAKIVAEENPKPRTRKEIGVEIMTVAGQLVLTKEEVEKWAQVDFKKSAKDLTLPEMETFLETLLHELGSRGAIA